MANLDLRDILFWVFIFIALILIIWRVFGESPSEFYILVTILIGMVMKISKLEGKFTGFEKVLKL